jgi:hypothetical protein
MSRKHEESKGKGESVPSRSGMRWTTEEEAQLIEMRRSGMNNMEISEQSGRSRMSIRNRFLTIAARMMKLGKDSTEIFADTGVDEMHAVRAAYGGVGKTRKQQMINILAELIGNDTGTSSLILAKLERIEQLSLNESEN